MATERAPVELTGGAGHEFEDDVAARFLIDLLSGRCSLGARVGKVVKIAWQARDSDWLADDLVLTCRQGATEPAEVGLSLKSDRQVTQSGFPTEFVSLAWEQWRGGDGVAALKGTKNAIGLVVGKLAAGVEDAWNSVACQVREAPSDLGRALARLAPPTPTNPGSQSSELQRGLVKSFARPPSVGPAANNPELEPLELISQLHLLHLDFRSSSSRQEVQALADCRALLVSGDDGDASRLWVSLRDLAGRKRSAGGTLTLPEVLAELRPHFALHAHPHFDADWRNIDRRAGDEMDNISNEIFQVGSLERTHENERIQECFRANKVAVLVGQSGAGKSALAKTAAVEVGARVCWLTAAALDADNASQFERELGLAHPLEAILRATPRECLLVIDGFEKFSLRALRLTEQLLRRLAESQASALSIVFTVQPDSLNRVVAIATTSGMGGERFSVIPIEPPPQSDIDALLTKDPRIHSASFNRGLRPVLRNLKISDWVARAIRAGAVLDASRVVNMSALIDWLWNCPWVAGADDGDSRSALLMSLAVKEIESLTAGVPRAALAPAEQGVLRGLEREGALLRRYERIFFQHDLLGDWSRLRTLMGEYPASTASLHSRAANPRWHNALVLYGLWLLEKDSSGLYEWNGLLRESAQAENLALRDTLLEAVFAASEPARLLELLWPSLVVDDGDLLCSLLDRFLYVCTIPDRRIVQIGMTADEFAQVEHSFRLPVPSQWATVLEVLHVNAAEVARLAPVLVARITCLWLRTTPRTDKAGTSFPARRQAAELALEVARVYQIKGVESRVNWGKESRIVFEALLRAAPDATEGVSRLCLQLAERRELDPEVVAHAEAATLAREQRAKQQAFANPELAAQRARLLGSAIPRGRLREPWPDGPQRPVGEGFRSACLDTDAFLALVQTDANIALEVLLAVCIEEPQHDDPYNASHDDVGLAYWHESYPARFFRGPFLQFFRIAPEQGLTFVVRLVNFASRREAEYAAIHANRMGGELGANDVHVIVEIGNEQKQWFGADSIFEWHYWAACGGMVVCVLQALERWLYELIDGQLDPAYWLYRVMNESESLAFAGVLIDVGKQQPSLFRDGLRPLLGCAELYALDFNAATRRTRANSSEMIGWSGQPKLLFDLARDWYAAPHRQTVLRDLAVDLLTEHEDLRSFFRAAKQKWLAQTDDMPLSSFRLLSERLTFENYVFFRDQDGNLVRLLRWPEDVRRAIEAAQPGFDAGTRLMSLPMRCRSVLKAGAPLTESERDELWRQINEVESAARNADGAQVESVFSPMDAICGGIAVLLTLHYEWLAADVERLTWCRAYLESTLSATAAAFGFESGVGDLHWDCFAADCAIRLLQADLDDVLARTVVAEAIAGKRYAATEYVMSCAFAVRAQMGDDFKRMQALAALWSALRRRCEHLKYGGKESAACDEEKVELVRHFVSRELSIERCTLLALSEVNREKMSVGDLGAAADRGAESRIAAVDVRVIQASFGWLHLPSAVSASEREGWRLLLLELLTFSLARVELDEERSRRSSTPSSPQEFDYWVLRVVAVNLSSLKNAEHERELWSAILRLGRIGPRWVAGFCSVWISAGAAERSAREWFVQAWTQMIRFALQQESWEPRYTPDYDLSRAVIDLLGFGSGSRQLFGGEGGANVVTEMLPALESGAARWFDLPPVVQAFASLGASPGIGGLLVPGIGWIHDAIRHPVVQEDEELDGHLIEFLRACWRVERVHIQSDPELTRRFRELLAHANLRGSHAAAALRDQVLGSIAETPVP